MESFHRIEFAVQLLGVVGAPEAAPAQPPAGSDFRIYVFGAYGAVLLLLLLFSLWTALQIRGVEKKLDHLKERLDRADRAEGADRAEEADRASGGK